MINLRQGSVDSGRQKFASSQITCQSYKDGHLANNCKYSQTSRENNHQTSLATDILICQICKKRGHSADKCRFRNSQIHRPVNLVQQKTIICQLCSKPGHYAKNCLKRQEP